MGNRCQLQGLVEKETSLGWSIKKTFMKDAVFEVGLKMFAPLDDGEGIEMKGGRTIWIVNSNEMEVEWEGT